RACYNQTMATRTSPMKYRSIKTPPGKGRNVRLDQVLAAVADQSLAKGAVLPSERELANSLKVARNVVRGAYEQLIAAGEISRKTKGRKDRSSKKSRNAPKGSSGHPAKSIKSPRSTSKKK